MTEVEVAELWQQTVKNYSSLLTVDKQVVRIMYPGRPSDEPGSDYKDAVIAVGGRMERGDIEVHVRSSDWHSHRHHRNKTYNGIILHVVMHHDLHEGILLENGNSIPTVSLGEQKRAGSNGNETGKRSSGCCPADFINTGAEEIKNVLDLTGDARFYEKKLAFQKEMKMTEAGQCLYRGIMGALGYSRNTARFQKVAEILPLNLLESMIRGSPDVTVTARTEALLLGVAGFLISQKLGDRPNFENDLWIEKLHNEWESGGSRRSLSPGDWQLFRIRPANFPARRLAGMAQLLLKYRNEGMLAGISSLIEESAQSGNPQMLEDRLMVSADGYWKDHFAPHKMCARLDPFLVGRSRAVEITINILLPLFSAFYEDRGQSAVCEEIFRLYCDYPATGENAVVRHMRRQLNLKQSQIKSVRCQQGLLHLYRRFCTQGKCAECALY